MIPSGLRARLAPLRPQPPIGGDVMYLGNVEIAIIGSGTVRIVFNSDVASLKGRRGFRVGVAEVRDGQRTGQH